jgi:hypothetical protein
VRDYSKVSGQFWTGKTGKSLRGDMQSQIVAMYLMTSPHSNMIGVFHCPILYIAHETGSPLEGATKALKRLSEGGFCTYDADSETVWVHEMARFQIGERLKPSDNRVKDIQKQYANLPEGRIKTGFFEKYGEAYCLENGKPLGSPLEAPTKPEAGTEAGTEKTVAPSGFDLFWAAWPQTDRKGAKGKCLEAWRKAKAESLTNQILAHVAALKKTEGWQKGFDPAPLVYLNQRRWEGAVVSAEATEPNYRRINGQWEQEDPDHGWFPVLESDVPEKHRRAA